MCKNLLFGLTLFFIGINSSQGYFCRRFTRVACTPLTSRSFNITKCKIAPLSKQVNVLIFEAEIMKALTHVKIGHQIYYKYQGFQNYHHLLGYENIDFCAAITNAKEATKLLLDECKKHAPDMCHPCPFNVGKIFVNTTPGTSDCPKYKKSWIPIMDTDSMWPDAEYKYELNLKFGRKNDETLKIVYGLLKHTGNKKGF